MVRPPPSSSTADLLADLARRHDKEMGMNATVETARPLNADLGELSRLRLSYTDGEHVLMPSPASLELTLIKQHGRPDVASAVTKDSVRSTSRIQVHPPRC